MCVCTLDDEAEAEAAERQEGEHRLLLGQGCDVTSCVMPLQLEGQGELCGLHILPDLRETPTQHTQITHSSHKHYTHHKHHTHTRH